MLQVVHSVAPGANLVFYTAEPNTAPGVTTEAGFANGILTLAKPVSAGGGGAKVIADDVGYYDEPFFQDGILAQAVDTVVGQGVAYFSAAGNESNYSYERPNPNFSTPSITPAGELLMSFDGGITTSLPLSIDSLSPGQFIAIVVQWDQPYVTGAPTSGGASSQIDICVTGQTGSYTVTDVNGKLTSCTGPNMVGSDPVQILILGNPANAASSAGNTNPEVVNLTIGLAGLTSAPTLIKLAVETNGQPDNPIPVAFQTNSPTVQGHPGAAGAAAVGAAFYVDTPACGTTPAMVEPYSSMGGGPILFDVAGTRLATPQMRQKPNFVGPDGINDTFLGQVLAAGYFTSTVKQCQNNANFPNFLGTSAATPHAAGVAALLLQANPALTPAEIYNAMQSTASAMGAVPNASSGYGFIQADAALASVQVKPLPPTVSVTPTSITAGGMATLNWSAVNATGCTASGTWSGAQKASGSMTISPATTGTFQYSLACTNSAGVSGVTNASLTVTAANTGGGGHGGALGEGLLLGLAGLGAARMRRVLRCGKGA
jgi:subtilisin family serine protease